MRLLAIILLLLPLQASQAADLLVDISARLVKNEITEGRFRQEKNIKILKKPLISTGTFTYHRKQGVIWQTLSPVPSVLLVNQTRLLTTQGEQNLPPAFGRVFTAMFGGDLQLMNEGFAIAGANGQGAWQLQLQPKDPLMQKIITGMQLTGDKELKQLDIREANGNFTRITFEQITHPETLTPAQVVDFERLSSPR
ncbi:outer membrane lipoprotein carrier protein LolA [Methylomicrobium sp. Wu6]|uniref:LolA family protein n=1 Tax=Methylomicrobium sp. Wu6 TaxID=3107928 RepID=UPI002DD654B6|nr:outer membrane lipoprotein carrier protein LolA [Methylomicrobium sp. Wu6]MEC4748663.1 outer membrane lipoprotein carrier protein LolA [Methylomicrobium sp. Wu6]